MTHAKTPLTASKDTYQVSQFWGHPYLANLSYFTLRLKSIHLEPCVLKNSEGKERALYYLSHTLVGAELNHSPIKKMCLALMFTVQKLRHYM